MSLSSFKTLTASVTEIQRLHGRKDAIEYLMAENNKHGHRRCKGEIVTTSRHDVVMTRCNRWECWRCADGTNGRLWQESQRVMLATHFLQWIGDIVYTLVVTFDRVPAVTEHEQQKQFAENLSNFLKLWKIKAKSNNWILLWVLGHGVKQTNGVIHAHIVCNDISDGIASPTKAHPNLMKSKWLQKRAKNNNLSLWIERARNHDAVGGYIGKNLEETIHADIVPNFRRVKTSQHMPRLRRKHEISDLTKAWLRDYGSGQVYARIGNLEPNRIPHGLIDDALKLGYTVTSSTEPITRENEVAQKSLSYIHTQVGKFSFADIVPTVQCCGCNKHFPRTKSYFLPSTRNPDNLTNTCIHCIEYDRNRETDFNRRIDKQITGANRNAWCGKKLQKSALLSYWNDDYCECLYCEKPIHKKDDFELDHINGTRQHRGENVIENVGFVHPACHQKKTNSGLDGRNYGATIGISVRGYAGVMQKDLF